ncbi:tetratricopeptide repeat protein 23-like [Rhinophrynus dorsalis]
MQSVPIYIPTDSTYADAGSQYTSPKTVTATHEGDDVAEDSISCSEESHMFSTERTHYTHTDSTPAEKLSRAQLMAEHFRTGKDYHRMNKELIRCVALSRIVYGDGHWRLAQAFANLAHSYLTLRAMPAQASQHAESAKSILLRGVDLSKSVEEKREIMGTLVTIYYTLGMAHLMQNNGKDSYICLQKVEKIVEELEDLQEREKITLKISEKDIALALGKACLLQHKPSSAINYFDQAEDLVKSSEGNALDLISLYQDMAKAEQMRKKYDRAIEHLLQAHLTSQSIYKNLSIEAAQTGFILAKAYAATGNSVYNESAEKHFTESLRAYQTVLGPDDPQTLNTCVEFSKWLIQIGKKEEAYKLMHGSVSSEVEFNESVADILGIMGSICLADGKIVKGYKLLKKCLEIQTAVYGSQHSKTRGTQNVLSTLQK